MRLPRALTLIAVTTPAAFAQQPALSIDDVVRVKHVAETVWSPDGESLAFTWDDRGETDLWTVSAESGDLTRITETATPPSHVAWVAGGSALAFIEGRRLWKHPRGAAETEELTPEDRRINDVAWSPDGKVCAYVHKSVIFYRNARGEEREIGRATPRGTVLSFSPDSTMLLANVAQAEGARWLVTDVVTQQSIWAKPTRGLRVMGWMPDNGHLFARRGERFVELALTDETTPLWRETEGGFAPELSPTGEHCLLTRADEAGWEHLWVVTLADGSATRLTRGDHEVSEPAWSPDGRSIVYVSNAAAPEERHLYVVPVAGGEAKRLTGALPGTNITPKWSPDGTRLAFLHCGPYRSLDLWVMPVDAPDRARQLTHSMPEAFQRDNVTVPELVVYEGALGQDIRAWLFKPKGFDPTRSYPAIVWVHGGPIRQMRYGWHPRRGYSIFYTYHQRLLQMGYVVLSVNYRGGVGYGREFRDALMLKMGIDDVVDVVEGGEYLKSQPFVDGDRVGVWGLSYGGFLTLQALGKHPGTFCMGINVAGVFDWATQVEIYNKSSRFIRFMGGTPEQNPEPYRVGSPVTYFGNIDVPLLNLHGKRDRNVPFSQMDQLIRAMVEHRLDFDVMYYPDQPHVFRDGDVWRHAFTKIERFFETHLKGAGIGAGR